MPGVKKYYRDIWQTVWQDANRRRDRYRNELFMHLVSLYEFQGQSFEQARDSAVRYLEQIDQDLARLAAKDYDDYTKL